MRYPASEKLEIIRLVEQSHQPVRRTLAKLGIQPARFYRWYDRLQTGGPEALEDKSPRPKRVKSAHEMSERRACSVIGCDRMTMRSRRPDDLRLRERLVALAKERRRFGYRRLHIFLRREGFVVNHKRLFRIYREERLMVRKRGGRKRALGTRTPIPGATLPNDRWSLDFVSDQLVGGRRFRILGIYDDCTRECLATVADVSLTGRRVACELDLLIAARGKPKSIVSEQRHRVHLKCNPELGKRASGGMALHRARQADAERLHRVFQWPDARRASQ
jgi:putative transposase